MKQGCIMTEIIGKTVAEAKNFLKFQGKKMRIIEQDGEVHLMTTEYLQNRINVRVDQGKIVAIEYFG